MFSLGPTRSDARLPRPASQWIDGRLGQGLEGFDYLVLNHFGYYEFCCNSLLALIGSYLVNCVWGRLAALNVVTDAVVAVVVVVLFAASHTALRSYSRGRQD